MSRHSLPRIATLSGAEVALARRLAVHTPIQTATGALCWAIVLLDADDRPLAEGRATSPDYPLPLVGIVQPHLDVLGLRVVGSWRSEGTPGDRPRYSAAVEVQEPRDD